MGFVIGVAVVAELATVVVVEEACRWKSNWVGLIDAKAVDLGKVLGMYFGIAAVAEDLERRGTHLEAVERKIGAAGGSNIAYSCDIAVYLWG